MGYCYTHSGALVCDGCGAAGGVRKRTCPHRVTYPLDGYSLPYCYPSALCPACYKAHKATLHATCAEGAATSNAEHAATAARVRAGDALVKAAWGDWHAAVPAGLVGVCFRTQGATPEYRLVPATSYQGGGGFLSDYADAQPWAGPDGAVSKGVQLEGGR